ncbi:MAG: nitrogen fixation protein NifM [Gammaproteobacteria bacterium RIFOXYA12_FULL_61_12]|nr:MAG: nitrogen fixation protein NifM [Gammaproteobacteria bacterium RIFOXYD12_FULL_61_37]OGT94159.1 MAG: nitrogen fixation protein NifM [Gammaproteobacteria bacterium RIFOXYA12_FULL_61_12]
MNSTPEFSYHLLRNALESYRKNLSQLSPEELGQVQRKARKSYELESLVLASPEAKGVTIGEEMLDRSLAQVAGRYASPEEFAQDLETNGLDEEGLRRALRRELVFDCVMQKVAAQSAAVSDIDLRLFHEMHRDRFITPERRVARHILITLNPGYPENSREAAFARMERLTEKLSGRTNRFADFARRHSECPTAMEGGKLGEVKQGQLYPELDRALFQMAEGDISPIIETEIGFHILLCERIKPGKPIPLSKVEARIREILEQNRRRNCQKAWIARLSAPSFCAPVPPKRPSTRLLSQGD